MFSESDGEPSRRVPEGDSALGSEEVARGLVRSIMLPCDYALMEDDLGELVHHVYSASIRVSDVVLLSLVCFFYGCLTFADTSLSVPISSRGRRVDVQHTRRPGGAEGAPIENGACRAPRIRG